MTDPPDRELFLFSLARQLPPAQRAAYLDNACLGNVALRQRVKELLQAEEQAGTFLQDPAPGARRPRVPPFDSKAVFGSHWEGERPREP